MKRKIRVLLVDDSAVARFALRRILESDDAFEVVGEARDGEEAVARAQRRHPDIVLMDVIMPGRNGLWATRELMAVHPVPILLVSDLGRAAADLSFDPLTAGAMDLARKPSAADLADPRFVEQFKSRLRLLSEVPVVRRRVPGAAAAAGTRGEPAAPSRPRTSGAVPPKSAIRTNLGGMRPGLVAVGASTGGPAALAALFESFRSPPPFPVVVAQHISAGFVDGLRDWLAGSSGLRVEVVRSSGLPLRAGTVYLAPEDRHLLVAGDSAILRDEVPGVRNHPSVDVLFRSLARKADADTTVAILLTGMGRDGAEGLSDVRGAGGLTVTQDRSSCVVYGMPKAALELDDRHRVLSLSEIGSLLASLVQNAG